ncbi:MAG: hypothetical protein HQ522_02485 [Bacteroidetes bacterium]|nr:hypothetical protein [Bacteroidota bacterium]
MKTKNNVQKAILRSVAVVISFVLISFTVSGQDFWKKLLANSSFNEIALAMVETTDEPKTANLAVESFNYAFLEDEYEPALEMENWMSSDHYFGVTSIQITEEHETDLELEDWMINENLFQVEENGDTPLELEAWMTMEKVWEI